MKRIKQLMVPVALFCALVYFSKPDRGGVGRCAATFALPGLHEIQLKHRPFFKWDLFESAKFRFTVSGEEFSKLSHQLSSDGYSEWKSGGLQFGSALLYGNGEDDFIYCSKHTPSSHFYWGYSEVKGVVYAISHPT